MTGAPCRGLGSECRRCLGGRARVLVCRRSAMQAPTASWAEVAKPKSAAPGSAPATADAAAATTTAATPPAPTTTTSSSASISGTNGTTNGASTTSGKPAAASDGSAAPAAAAPVAPNAAAVVAGRSSGSRGSNGGGGRGGGGGGANGSSGSSGSSGGGSRPPDSKKNLARCQQLVGYHVKFTYNQPPDRHQKTLQGIVFAAYGSTLVLQESSGLRLVSIACMNKPEILKEKDGSEGSMKIQQLDSVSELDGQALNAKFEEAMKRRKHMLDKRNPQASAWAHKIFDDLLKTCVAWSGSSVKWRGWTGGRWSVVVVAVMASTWEE